MGKKLLFALLFLGACTAPNQAEKLLHSMGYKNVHITGYSLFGCGQDDRFHTRFVATAPSGDVVKGIVCGGLLKGSTVRFF